MNGLRAEPPLTACLRDTHLVELWTRPYSYTLAGAGPARSVHEYRHRCPLCTYAGSPCPDYGQIIVSTLSWRDTRFRAPTFLQWRHLALRRNIAWYLTLAPYITIYIVPGVTIPGPVNRKDHASCQISSQNLQYANQQRKLSPPRPGKRNTAYLNITLHGYPISYDSVKSLNVRSRGSLSVSAINLFSLPIYDGTISASYHGIL